MYPFSVVLGFILTCAGYVAADQFSPMHAVTGIAVLFGIPVVSFALSTYLGYRLFVPRNKPPRT